MAHISGDEPLYAALRERLAASGLARVADDLLALAQPAIRLDLTRVRDEAAIPPGASKVGGEPDLPAGTPWPTARDGMPLPFIAQIRLADIAPHDPEGDLPHAGLLSFFYAMNDEQGAPRGGDDPTAWRVIWTRVEPTSLARLATPAALLDAPDAHFPACSVAFVRRLTLPAPESYAAGRMDMTREEWSGYFQVANGVDAGYPTEMDMRLLGHPYELQPPTFERAYRAAYGLTPRDAPGVLSPDEALQEWRHVQELAREVTKELRPPDGGYHSEEDMRRALEDFRSRVATSDAMRALQAALPGREPPEARRARDEARAEMDRTVREEWRLLLQAYSEEEAQMDWAASGLIHFGIPRAALAARDFSQVWVSLQLL